jgi:hypothetical protein
LQVDLQDLVDLVNIPKQLVVHQTLLLLHEPIQHQLLGKTVCIPPFHVAMALKAEQSLLQMDDVMVVVVQQVVVAHKVVSKALSNTEQELEARLNGSDSVVIPDLIQQVALRS